MTRNVAWVLLLAAIAVPAFAGSSNSGSVSGYVKNSSGVPQIGAVVEIFAAGTTPATTVFTDASGFFSASTLAGGMYRVKVTAPSFLPALRENVNIRSGANMIVNVTLNTLYEAIQLAPARRYPGEDDDDWKWTLRTMSSRPVLRVLDGGPTVVSRSESSEDKVLRARVAFIAGSEADGGGGAAGSTVFDVETSMFSSGKLDVSGNLAYNGQSSPATVVRAAYTREMANGSRPEIAMTARRFAVPFEGIHDTALQAVSLSASDDFVLFDVANVKLGSEFETISMFSRASDFKPFGRVDVHLAPGTTVSYSYATTQPTMRATKGFDTAPADLSESGPRMSVVDFSPALERARHQEVSLNQRIDSKTTVGAAFYSDSISNPALIGVGDPDMSAGEFLSDLFAGTFTYAGRSFETKGLRLLAERKLTNDLVGTLDYSYGGALDLPANTAVENARAAMEPLKRHTVGCKVQGKTPVTHTRWIASYRWSSGPSITPVDMFNASVAQTDPYMNVFLRQPVPTLGFLPKMEAIVDVRNLLAQGYTPVIGSDGRMIYLVQSARAFRGGVSFSF